ncbi:MAG: hypothetical protein AAFR81_01625 [Chloroflexota bacterium]
MTEKKKIQPSPHMALASITISMLLVISVFIINLSYKGSDVADIFIPRDCINFRDFTDSPSSLFVRHNLFGEIRIVIEDTNNESLCTMARFNEQTNYAMSYDGAYLAFTRLNSYAIQQLYIASVMDGEYWTSPIRQGTEFSWSLEGNYMLAETTLLSNIQRGWLHVFLTLYSPTERLWHINVNEITPTTHGTASWDGDTVVYDYENPDIADCRISLAGEVEGCGNMP